MGLIISKRIKDNNTYIYTQTVINDEGDLLVWINDNIGVHKYVGINRNLSEFVEPLINNDAKVSHKDFLRSVKRHTGSTRTMNVIGFWITRGYSNEDAKIKVREFQSIGGDKFADNIKKNPESYNDINPTQTKYWMKKGYSEEESIRLVSERQKTFSLELCIKKHGKEKGIKVFNNRQYKWLLSREQSLNEGVWDWSSCGKSFSEWELTYGAGWVNNFIDYVISRPNSKNSDLYETIKTHSKNLKSYLLNLSFHEFKPLSNIGLVNYLTGKTPIELKEFWCNTNNVKFISTKFGNISYNNGKFYQSEGEFEIGKYLESIGIEFITHKQYENTFYITDFYLPGLDLYIEYMGMNGKSYDEKRKSLNKLNFKIIWSSDLNFIKNKINEKIHRN